MMDNSNKENQPPSPELTIPPIEFAREKLASIAESLKESAKWAYEPETLLCFLAFKQESPGEFDDALAALRKSKALTLRTWNEALDRMAADVANAEVRRRRAEIEATRDPEEEAARAAENHIKAMLAKKESVQKAIDIQIRLSQRGSAEEVFEAHRHNFRYVPENEGWAVWDGRRWDMQGDEDLTNCISDLGKAYSGMAADSKLSDAERELYCGHGAELLKNTYTRDVKTLMRAVARQQKAWVPTANFDQRTDYITAANGAINLQTGQIEPFDREHYALNTLSVPYDPAAKCPIWENALSKIFQNKTEMIEYVQRLLGYTLTGQTKEKALIIGYGSMGNNGKSKICNIMAAILGPYAKATPTSTFMEKKTDQTNDLAALHGARFVYATEANQRRSVDTELLKKASGDEPMTARFLHKEFFTFRPRFTMFLMCNHRPEAPQDDQAWWNRVHLIPFETKFVLPDDPAYHRLVAEGRTVDEDAKEGCREYLADKHLEAKLEAELPGILAWLVRGAVSWYTMGLQKPQEVKAATLAYRTDMDSIEAFLQECCEVGDETLKTDHRYTVRAGDVMEAYKAFCKQYDYKALYGREFNLQLEKARGGEQFKNFRQNNQDKESGRKPGTYWQGLRLIKVDYQSQPDGHTNGTQRRSEPDQPRVGASSPESPTQSPLSGISGRCGNCGGDPWASDQSRCVCRADVFGD